MAEGDGRLEMGGRASRQEADRHTLSERDTETQNERGEYTGERYRWRQKKDPEAHRETHIETHT